MSHINVSELASRARGDALADIFNVVGPAARAYNQAGGQFLRLDAGAPDSELLPTEHYAKFTSEVLAANPDALNYGMPAGMPPVRQAMADQLRREGVVLDSPDDILVTHGGMEALSFAAAALIRKGDTVLTEKPGFPGALSLFHLLGAKIVLLECGDQGVLPADLERAMRLHKPRLVSLIPDGPAGSSMPEAHREQIANLLEANDTFALEDSAYSLLRFDGAVRRPLQSYSPDRVARAGSYSKTIAPGLRLGTLVAPRAIRQIGENFMSTVNMQSSRIHQEVTARFLEPSTYGVLLANYQYHYRVRSQAMQESLAKYFPEGSGYHWNQPEGGMFLWLTTPQSTNVEERFTAALANGVSYIPAKSCWPIDATDAPTNLVRLNFASTSPDNMDEAIRRLAVTFGVIKN